MRRLLLVAAASALLPGCMLGSGGAFSAGPKTVGSKEPPITLVAVDGSHCQVAPDRFERTKIGDRVWCGWRDPGAAPRPGEEGRRPVP
jgi:hypothetical protein